MARCCVGSGKAIRRRDRDTRIAPTGFRAFCIGNAVDGPRRVFGFSGGVDKHIAGWFLGVADLKGRRIRHKLFRFCQTAVRILRHGFRHRDSAFYDIAQRIWLEIRRRDDSLLFAYKYS